MSVAIFDLDHTILEGDSTSLWGRFMVARGLVADPEAFIARNQKFDEDYLAGNLDPQAYFHFLLKPMSVIQTDDLLAYNHQFIDEVIHPLIRPAALERMAAHRKQNDAILIATSTCDFIASPIAHLCGSDGLVATVMKQVAGHYTGKLCGEPAYGEAKVRAVSAWMQEHGESWCGSTAYTDSHVDLPLLKAVDNPVAINPDAMLEDYARQNYVPIEHFSLRV